MLKIKGNPLLDNYTSLRAETNDGSDTRSLIYLSKNDNVIIGNSAGSETYLYSGTGSYIKPYYAPGDSFTIGMTTAGYVSNEGKRVVFTVPINKSVVGVGSVSVVSTDGFVSLRQSGSYVGGTNGTTDKAIQPTSNYTATVRGNGNCVSIEANWNNALNGVTSADAIGIVWYGTITFNK